MNREAPELGDLLFPLTTFEGHGPLPADVIAGRDVPQPYRQLLVHDSDMTSTLEDFFGQPLKLRVLHKRIDDNAMLREVLLVGMNDGRAVEYGSIRIELARFLPDVRAEIEACERPLGGILREANVSFKSRPSAFLKLRPEPGLLQVLGAGDATVLYGRRNTLTTLGGDVIAQILEVLPPIITRSDA